MIIISDMIIVWFIFKDINKVNGDGSCVLNEMIIKLINYLQIFFCQLIPDVYLDSNHLMRILHDPLVVHIL